MLPHDDCLELSEHIPEEVAAPARPGSLREPQEGRQAIDGVAPWERACAEGWEGVIAKRRDSPYEHRRSKLWLKMKCEASNPRSEI